MWKTIESFVRRLPCEDERQPNAEDEARKNYDKFPQIESFSIRNSLMWLLPKIFLNLKLKAIQNFGCKHKGGNNIMGARSPARKKFSDGVPIPYTPPSSIEAERAFSRQETFVRN
jgi:hypothetical protein